MYILCVILQRHTKAEETQIEKKSFSFSIVYFVGYLLHCLHNYVLLLHRSALFGLKITSLIRNVVMHLKGT